MPIFCTRKCKVIQFSLDFIEKNFRADQLVDDIGIVAGYHPIDQVNELMDLIVIDDVIGIRVMSDSETSSSVGKKSVAPAKRLIIGTF
jgi:hypothetical protein